MKEFTRIDCKRRECKCKKFNNELNNCFCLLLSLFKFHFCLLNACHFFNKPFFHVFNINFHAICFRTKNKELANINSRCFLKRVFCSFFYWSFYHPQLSTIKNSFICFSTFIRIFSSILLFVVVFALFTRTKKKSARNSY